MNIGGDLLWKVADFPEAQELARRWRKIIPPNITGDAPNPQQEQLMHQASDKIQQLTAMVGDLTKKAADKDRELDLKAGELTLREKEASVEQQRLDYEAETKRLVALGNSGPAISPDTIKPIVEQLLNGMLRAGEPDFKQDRESQLADSVPGVPGSKQGPDGNHYVQHPVTGQHYRIDAPDKFHPAHIGAKQAPDGGWYVKNNKGEHLKVLHNA
jgi:hypothetical protein